MEAKDKLKKDKGYDDEDDFDCCVNICDKECEVCVEPCEERCDDCQYDEIHEEFQKED